MMNHGYIALITAIVMATLLMAISLSLNMRNYLSEKIVLEWEAKRESAALAEACVDTALVRLAGDAAYVPIAGGDVVPMGMQSCLIRSIVSAGSVRTIITSAHSHSAFTAYQVAVTLSPASLVVNSWEELPNPP